MTRLLAALALVALTTPAIADDEGSEHTAYLVGSDADKLGVTVSYVEGSGWSMDVRPKPGDPVITTRLALPQIHAHYLVSVTAGRGSIAFVENSAGHQPTAKDTIGWVYTPQGTLLRSWTYSAVLRADELAKTSYSISHWQWSKDAWKETTAGIEFTTRTGRTVVLAADATTLK